MPITQSSYYPETPGSIKSIQRGQISVGPHNGYGSVTISPVNIQKCVVSCLGGNSSVAGVWLSNSTTIQVSMFSSSVGASTYWQVVEYY